ncbi:glucosamine-6-phosphate deaminase, partial [bacterium]|nr:glucosamine-6-phosphate deaminase [bacterium]
MIHETVRENPSAVLGLATGGTPVGVYRLLVKRFQAGQLDFSKVTSFNLDEYVGLGPEHDQSYRYFMQQ